MKRKIVLLCVVGALLGLAISTMITIVISIFIDDGKFYAVVPELAKDCGSEINAVVVQGVCSLLYGAAWAGASLIWKKENWSLLRQTLTHLCICSAATFPIAYFMRWMDHSFYGVLGYLGIFFGIYAVIWGSQYLVIKKKIKAMNMKVNMLK